MKYVRDKRTCDGRDDTGGTVNSEGSLGRNDGEGDGVACVAVTAADGGHLDMKEIWVETDSNRPFLFSYVLHDMAVWIQCCGIILPSPPSAPPPPPKKRAKTKQQYHNKKLQN